MLIWAELIVSKLRTVLELDVKEYKVGPILEEKLIDQKLCAIIDLVN